MITGNWMSATFIHYEIDPAILQPHVPFPLDARGGKAYVSAVAFTQERVRLAGWPVGWFASHRFLNLRTYVRVQNEPGIFFLTEWVPRRSALWVAPRLFGLPYRLGTVLPGDISDAAGRFAHREERGKEFGSCRPGTLDEFLLERYVAFTERRGVRRRFSVAHEPWPQTSARVTVTDDSLMRAAMPWWLATRLVDGNYSPGVREVRVSWPRRVGG